MIVARTLYGEARGQSKEGKIAVANVMANRVKSGTAWWGYDLTSVCLWPLQFSCWNHDDRNRSVILKASRSNDPEFLECLEIAAETVGGSIRDNTSGSLHYVNPTVANPNWLRGKTPVITIGDHVFFNDVE